MRKVSVVVVVFCALVLSGCGTVRSVHPLGTVDTALDQSSKGYVEFMSVNKTNPIPIFQLDDRRQPVPVGSVGLRQGDWYCYPHYQSTIVENLRVAAPPGQSTFVIEQNGTPVRVPVVAGKITPVEIDQTVIGKGDLYKIYRLNYRIFEPVPYQKQRLVSTRKVKATQ